jgi:hypothetical protein
MSPSQRALFSRAYSVGTDAEALAGEIARHLAQRGLVASTDAEALAAEIAPALAVHDTLVHAEGAVAARAAAHHGLGEVARRASVSSAAA